MLFDKPKIKQPAETPDSGANQGGNSGTNAATANNGNNQP